MSEDPTPYGALPDSECHPAPPTRDERMASLSKSLEDAINRHNAEAESDTPDFIIGEFLVSCLSAWNEACNARKRWYAGTPEERIERNADLLYMAATKRELKEAENSKLLFVNLAEALEDMGLTISAL